MNKYKVVFAGHTFTRSSKNRTYTHAVIVTSLVSDARDTAIRNGRAAYRINVEHYTAIANGTSRYLKRNGNQFAHVEDETRIAEAQAWIASGEQGSIDRHLLAVDQAKNRTPDGLCFVGCAGWCGRLDLAQKLAGTIKHGTPHILPVENA